SPGGPTRIPGLWNAVARAFARDGEAIELPGKADCAVANIDHLPHLAEPLGQDLAGFERNKPTEFTLRRSELFTEKPHELASFWRRLAPPCAECILGETYGAPRFIGCRLAKMRNDLACDRRAGRQTTRKDRACGGRAGRQPRVSEHRVRHSKPLANFECLLAWRGKLMCFLWHRAPRGRPS